MRENHMTRWKVKSTLRTITLFFFLNWFTLVVLNIHSIFRTFLYPTQTFKTLIQCSISFREDRIMPFMRSSCLNYGELSIYLILPKKSGLTVLTNAKIDNADLERNNDGCKGNTRKRRDADCKFSNTFVFEIRINLLHSVVPL